MVVLDVCLDNFYAFKNFHINLTYPKKIVGSCIQEEYLKDRPNFRYKKVNIIMGANASGKTSFGRTLMKIFNFIDDKNFERMVDIIGDKQKEASFTLDMASKSNMLYRVSCKISPSNGEKYTTDHIHLEVRQETIRPRDSYESCVKRLAAAQHTPQDSYIEELEMMEKLYWLFEYPRDNGRILDFPPTDDKFCCVLEHILKALDPSIRAVKKSRDVDNAYVIQLQNKSIILQDGERMTTELLSSGTKSGVEIARFVSALMQGRNHFYYCDEKFSYVHSDIEKVILSLMINSIQPNNQLFFTTHNTDILDMNLPKHAFTFLRKDMDDADCPITCVDASSLLKRNTDSLKNAVQNDLFSTAPAVDLIYAISDL